MTDKKRGNISNDTGCLLYTAAATQRFQQKFNKSCKSDTIEKLDIQYDFQRIRKRPHFQVQEQEPPLKIWHIRQRHDSEPSGQSDKYKRRKRSRTEGDTDVAFEEINLSEPMNYYNPDKYDYSLLNRGLQLD